MSEQGNPMRGKCGWRDCPHHPMGTDNCNGACPHHGSVRIFTVRATQEPTR